MQRIFSLMHPSISLRMSNIKIMNIIECNRWLTLFQYVVGRHANNEIDKILARR